MRPLFTIGLLFATTLLTAQSGYYIKFPDDIFTDCSSPIPPQFYNPDSLTITLSHQDQVFSIIIPDACYQIEREWKVQGPDYDPAKPCVWVPNPNSNTPWHSPDSRPGAIISAPNNTLPGWEATVAFVSPSDSVPLDYSLFYTGGLHIYPYISPLPFTIPAIDTANCLVYKQFIKVVDLIPPTVSDCPAEPPVFVDSSQNDTAFWHAGYWLDPVSQSHNLNDAPAQLAITATDQCEENYVDACYHLFLDLDQDGSQETFVNSASYFSNPGQVHFGNVNTPNYNGGTLQYFDQRAVAANQKYQFGLKDTMTSNGRRFTVAWHTMQAPNVWVTPQFPNGTHRIEWLLADACGNPDTCAYLFTVKTPTPDYYVKFPAPLHLVDCAETYTPPILYNPDSLNITVDYEDLILLITPACFTITRTWSVKSPHYDPTLGCTYVLSPQPNASLYAPENLIGVTIAAPDNTIPGWEPTVVKINAQDSAATDYSVFYAGGTFTTSINGASTAITVPPIGLSNCLLYIQKIDVVDTVAPLVLNCPAVPPVFQDSTTNNPKLWNAAYWFNPVTQTNNLGEAPVQLSVVGKDECYGNSAYAPYLLFLDLDQDGTQETVINSNNPPPAGQVYFDNVNTPNYNGGTLRDFDQRAVPANQKYRFGLQQLLVGGTPSFNVAWHTQQAPQTWIPAQLPAGNHRIKWVLEDGCGNQTNCEYPFTVHANDSVAQYYIKFPDDVYTMDCSTIYTPPLLYNPDSMDITIVYEDVNWLLPTDACYTFERNWYVRPANYDPALPCTRIPNPYPIIAPPHALVNRLGVTISAPGNTVPGWEPTQVKIQPQDSAPTDYSVFYTGGSYTTLANSMATTITVPPIGMANCFHYIQTIDIIDIQQPAIIDCPATTLLFADSTSNDSLLWHADYWLDPISKIHDLNDIPVSLSLSATDDCTGSSVDLRYLLFLDLDGDGVQETVINRNNLPPAGQLYFGNALTPNYAGGVLQYFDQRPVPVNQKYRFGEHSVFTGNNQSSILAWHTILAPNTWVPLQLPSGHHSIKWFVGDGCGNETICEYPFTVTAPVVSSAAPEEGFTEIGVSPNPATGNAMLHFSNLYVENARFDLYDGLGRLVLNRQISGSQVALERPDLAAGLYYFKILEKGKIQGVGKLSIID